MTSQGHRPLSARDILTSVGEVVYEWDIASDAIRWGANVVDVLGLNAVEPVGTGASYAALMAEAGDGGRREAIATSPNTDDGRGVPYRIEYALQPRGPTGPTLRVDDSGRWFADARGKPERAHGVIRLVDARQDALSRLASQPRIDQMTGQLTRNHLLAMLRDCVGTLEAAGRRQAAFMVAAIEGLAEINEAMGMAVGDQVIAEVAGCIRSQFRAGDVVGRYSGATFGILVMNCGDKAMAIAAERFASAVRNAAFPYAGPVGPRLSIGGVLIPRQARSAEEAMLAAEQALRRARAERPGGFVAALPEDRIGARPLEIARALAAAIDGHDLHVALDPIRNGRTGSIVGHRWLPQFGEDEARTGLDEYRDVADRFGLAGRHDLMVLERVAADLGSDADLALSVPVCAGALLDSRWLKLAVRLLGRRPEDAARLMIEVEAGTVSRHPAAAEVFASELNRLGARLAVTGFGVEAVGPDLLRRLAPRRIELAAKLVEGFAENPYEASFLEALVRLARATGADVLAPAVTDHALAARLGALGVALFRGEAAQAPNGVRHAIETLSA